MDLPILRECTTGVYPHNHTEIAKDPWGTHRDMINGMDGRYGALAGGPDVKDEFRDNRGNIHANRALNI